MSSASLPDLAAGLEVAIASDDTLGEGPWWSTRSSSLWRVDIRKQLIHCWRPGDDTHREWALPDQVGCFVPSPNETAGVAALSDGMYWFDVQTGALTQIAELEGDIADNLFNDGKCDRSGNLWVGSKHVSDAKLTGHLYRIDTQCRVTQMLDRIGVSNGIAWSPDNKICYYTDSAQQTIWTMTTADGRITSREIFVKDTDGYPDGLTVDAEGCIWSAKWDGGRVVRYTPDGKIDTVLEMPVSRPTSVMFGGEDLGQLYITSARVDREHEAMAGHVFVFDSKTCGIAETPYDYNAEEPD